MSHWNYRVCKTVVDDTVTNYSIHEAYYNKDGSIWAITENAVAITEDISPFGCETEEEVMQSLKTQTKKMELAYTKPVIDLTTFVFAKQE